MTKQQKLIFDIIAASRAHPTAQEVYQHARGLMPSISLATVYRNLGSLVDSGTVLRISQGTLPDRYDLPAQPHWHLICDVCGSVRDFPEDSAVIEQLERLTGEHITSSGLIAHCICGSCRDARRPIND